METRKTQLISRLEIEELLSMGEAVEAVECAFKLVAEKQVIMPPKSYLCLPKYKGDFRIMPACIDEIAGIKWVSVYPNNKERDLPTVMAVIIINDPQTGYPIAIMDGTFITNVRTGAAGGVAAKYLARRESSVVGIIGAGVQAETQLLAISKVLPGIKEAKVFDQHSEASARYVDKMRKELDIELSEKQSIQEVTEADIVVTTTPSTKPIIKKHYIKPGTHINAIGADAPGKQELDAPLLIGAKIVVDDIEQSSHAGEINVPLSEGVIKAEDIYVTLGEVVAGMKKGRESDEEITIFDSTGLAVQDIICAQLVCQRAKHKRIPALQLL